MKNAAFVTHKPIMNNFVYMKKYPLKLKRKLHHGHFFPEVPVTPLTGDIRLFIFHNNPVSKDFSSITAKTSAFSLHHWLFPCNPCRWIHSCHHSNNPAAPSLPYQIPHCHPHGQHLTCRPVDCVWLCVTVWERGQGLGRPVPSWLIPLTDRWPTTDNSWCETHSPESVFAPHPSWVCITLVSFDMHTHFQKGEALLRKTTKQPVIHLWWDGHSICSVSCLWDLWENKEFT